MSIPMALLLLSPFDILASLAMDIYLPAVPDMPDELDTSRATIQLTLTVYIVLLGVGQLLFGPLSDRFGRRPVLLAGGVIYAISTFALAAASSGSIFVALRSLQALGASAALVATFATVRDVYGRRPEATFIYGILGAILSFVPAAGPILGALVLKSFGWRAIFVLLGALMVVAIMNAWRGWVETRPERLETARPSFRPMLTSLRFWTFTMGFSAAMGTFFTYFSTSSHVLIDRAGYTELEFSLAFATTSVVMIVSAPLARRVADRYGTAGCFTRGLALLAVGAALLALGEWLLEPGFVSFILPMWICAVGIVLTSSVAANGALDAFGDTAGTAVALYFSIQSVLVGLGGTMAVYAFGSDRAWPVVAFTSIAVSVALLLLIRLWRASGYQATAMR